MRRFDAKTFSSVPIDQYSAVYREAEHPRDEDGKFKRKRGVKFPPRQRTKKSDDDSAASATSPEKASSPDDNPNREAPSPQKKTHPFGEENELAPAREKEDEAGKQEVVLIVARHGERWRLTRRQGDASKPILEVADEEEAWEAAKEASENYSRVIVELE